MKLVGSKPSLQKIIIEPLYDDVQLPTYATEGDSGMDVYARETVVIPPQSSHLFKLGFKLGIPRHPLHDLGYRWECQVRPRSGISLKTMLRVANAPGTIDNFYTDEVGIIITNTRQMMFEVNYDRDYDDEGNFSKITDIWLTQINSNFLLDLKDNHVHISEIRHELSPPDSYVDLFPEGSYIIRKGDRIAQLVFMEVVRPLQIVVGKVDDSVSRGGGFGSTGV